MTTRQFLDMAKLLAQPLADERRLTAHAMLVADPLPAQPQLRIEFRRGEVVMCWVAIDLGEFLLADEDQMRKVIEDGADTALTMRFGVRPS